MHPEIERVLYSQPGAMPENTAKCLNLPGQQGDLPSGKEKKLSAMEAAAIVDCIIMSQKVEKYRNMMDEDEDFQSGDEDDEEEEDDDDENYFDSDDITDLEELLVKMKATIEPQKADTEDELTPRQHIALEKLLAGNSPMMAAICANVSRDTVYRWQKLPVFKLAIQKKLEEKEKIALQRQQLAMQKEAQRQATMHLRLAQVVQSSLDTLNNILLHSSDASLKGKIAIDMLKLVGSPALAVQACMQGAEQVELLKVTRPMAES